MKLSGTHVARGVALIGSLALAATSCQTKTSVVELEPVHPPAPQREFRGAWVATVANIDWPSKRTLSAAEQKQELITILDRAVQLRLNAIVLQVRPACDALYNSSIEPWSEYLTGEMGKPPEPYYDPLAFAVDEAHKRGLELHAWFNPYRARHASARGEVSSNHVSKTRPNIVRRYGRYLWLDPGERETQEYSRSVILDVVKRYNVNGVHMDDYFYPYQEKDANGKIIDFPDEPSWKRYVASGGTLSRNDWRRENVNTFIETTYKAVKAEKPWVKFGISPFGIWRPGHPPQIQGFDAYEVLYADARKWFVNGWLDYLAPQLYWSTEAQAQSYPVLLQWWAEQNEKNRHLWPGNNTTAAGKWGAGEIINQIKTTRTQVKSGGNIHWNVSSLMKNTGGIADLLPETAYAESALIPAMTWLSNNPPPRPDLRLGVAGGSLNLNWNASPGTKVWQWLLQTQSAGEWTTDILPASQTSRLFSAGPMPDAVAISAVDLYGNVSPPVVYQAKTQTARQ